MNLSVGIVGLPNVGKSTLFNALLRKQQALAANYPFATIEPNVGVVGVPDARLEVLAKVVKTEKIVPATVKFVDIAGLVAGASKGEGLGNKFLAHIREVDAIVHVIRGFSDENVVRAGSTDPKSDEEVIETELMLADLETLNKFDEKKLKSDPGAKIKISGVLKLRGELEKGVPGRNVVLTEEERTAVRELNLLTMKPLILVLNVDETEYKGNDDNNEEVVRICAKLEAELAELGESEQREYLEQLGRKESGLQKLIKNGFRTLGLQTFLTAGEKEVRAWTIKVGSTAVEASGVIHTDFMKHFIKADVISFDEFVQLGGWIFARESGKVRIEGRDYIMREGDVVEFKIGV